MYYLSNQYREILYQGNALLEDSICKTHPSENQISNCVPENNYSKDRRMATSYQCLQSPLQQHTIEKLYTKEKKDDILSESLIQSWYNRT